MWVWARKGEGGEEEEREAVCVWEGRRRGVEQGREGGGEDGGGRRGEWREG